MKTPEKFIPLDSYTNNERFWRDFLCGLTAPIQLPNFNYLNLSNSSQQSWEFSLSSRLTSDLKTFAQNNELSLYTLIKAAVALLVSKYTSETDILFGATNEKSDFHVVPMRVSVEADAVVLSLLKQIQKQWSRLQDYEYISLQQIQQCSEIPPESPMFEVVVIFGKDGNLENLEEEKYPLVLFFDDNSELLLKINYDTNHFADDAIERMSGHLQTILTNIINFPEGTLANISLLPEQERHQLLIEWNQIKADYPLDKCIHELFEEQVEKTPNAVAVVFEERQLTYRELNQRANQLANYLRVLGVNPEFIVGICTERSIEMIIGILGILKAGGAYIPLDITYPQERLAFMLLDSQVSILLTQQHLVEKLPVSQARIVCLDTDVEQFAKIPLQQTKITVKPHNLAYIIYTSGSTGEPKGVLIPHCNVVRLFAATQAWFQFNQNDVWSLFHSYAFDFSVWEIFGSLLHGGRLVIIPYYISRSPELFYQLLSQEKVTVLNQTPSAFQQLMQVEQLWNHEHQLNLELSLRLVIFGGESLDIQSLKPWFDRHGDQLPQVVNMYGITETTVHVTYRPININDLNSSAKVIGSAIPDLQIYILNSYLQPVPIGVAGEIYVGGAGLARGYLNRPELTNEKFIAHPFNHQAEARLYKTGDLGRYLPNGDIEYLGRIDNQVKIRGFRIELGEIEAVLNQHTHIKAAKVISREEIPGDQRLVAYLILNSHEYSTSEIIQQIREYLKQQLPNYMIPAAFVVLDSFPLTQNGKIDYRALPAANFTSTHSNYIAPRTPQEEIIANIWSQVLKVNHIGINDNFFELGGHSLLATQVISHIRQTLNQEIPLRLLFEYPTIGQFSQHIDINKLTDNDLLTSSIEARGNLEQIPLSFAQQRLWFLDQLQPHSNAYNLVYNFEIQGLLNIPALERSIAEIIERHDILRTNFQMVDGEPTQIIRDSNFNLSVIDLQSLSDEHQEREIAEITKQEAEISFNLAEDVLFRVKLIRWNQEKNLLLFNIHHIIFDGWSFSILVAELEELYTAYSQGLISPLTKLSIQYSDFSFWQRKWLVGNVLELQLNYWKQKLSGNLPILELPIDHLRPRMQTYKGATKSFVLSQELTASITSLAQQEGVTVFMTLLAAFKVLLCRYSGQEDVIVGTPIAGRNRKEIEGLMGFFVNTLALRTDLGAHPSFRELLSRVRQVCLEAYTHQDVPFEQLVEVLQPERDLSHTPIFQVMFALQNVPIGELQLPNLSVKPLEPLVKTAKFDLTLSMEERNGCLVGEWEYNTDLFDDTTIERMVKNFQVLLSGILTAPEQNIWELPLLDETERHQLLVTWNHHQVSFTNDQCIHQLFEEQVEKTPDAVAVIFDNQEITYQELNQRANQLANYLRVLGINPEVIVGICTERSIEMIIGILGILKAGGAYVPLDPDYPTERLRFMLEDAQVSILLTQKHLVEKLPENQTQIVYLDTDADEFDYDSDISQISQVKASNLAYVLYTSGSTGKPKAVAIEHRSPVALVSWAKEVFTKEELAGVLASTSICFDLSVFELFVTLSVGGKVILAQNALHLPTLTAANQVTLINTVPSAIAQLIRDDHLPQQVCTVNLAGEPLQNQLVQQIYQRSQVKRVFNLYGPSEDTTYSTFSLIEQGATTSPTIGRPISNTQVYILDQYLQPVPVGVPGELHLGGVGLARGYLNRPELTQEKFISHPFDTGRLYKTGDLVRYLPSGNIEYLARIDNQVKIRGFRIELGEIEGVLSQHRDLQASCIIAREDNSGDKRLVAYVVAKHGYELSISQLRSFLSGQLPQYMVPHIFVILKSLPLTLNGKIDRRALPEPNSAELLADSFVAPRNQIEEILTQIWAEVLRVEKVGINDNFFELGGHSLLATQVISHIRQTLNQEIPLRLLFEYPTIGQFSQHIDINKLTDNDLLTSSIEARGNLEQIPLSFAQQRLWFLDQLQPHSNAYNLVYNFEIQGLLNIPALERSIAEIIERHDILRTNFQMVDGEPTQIIRDSNFNLSVIDLQSLSDEHQEREIAEITKQEAEISFNLAEDVLFRVKLIRWNQEKNLLLFNIHHIIFDGWSFSILVAELEELYTAYSQGLISPLTKLSIQYSDFSFWQRKWLVGNVLELQLNYWKQKLSGNLPILELPIDHLRPRMQTYKGATKSFVLSQELTASITSLAQQEGVTVFMTLLAAFKVLLCRYSGQEDVIVGTPIAGRNRKEIEGLMGFFVNTLALRTDLGAHPSFRELLSRVRQVCLEAYTHQDVPFEQLVEVLQPERDLSHTPIFQVMFALQNVPIGELQLPNLSVKPLEPLVKTAKFDLTLSMEERNGCLVGEWEYNTDLFDDTTIERMVKNFQVLLSGILTAPEQNIWELPLLDETERHQLLVTWNHHQVSFTNDQCIHQLFEEQVEKTPDAVAVIFDNQEITYQELNQRANQLANYLRVLGINPEVIVGICTERSIEMIIGILGILKAGGAYVPLDPDYPTERLRFMLEDAQVSILLTQKHLVEKLPENQTQIVYLDTDADEFDYDSDISQISQVKASNLAYVLYTSGSTGKPKAVAIEHRSPVALVSWAKEVFTKEELAGVLASTSICFDLSVFELFVTLSVGGKVILAQNALHLPTLTAANQVTLINTVPSAIAQLIRDDHLPQQVCTVNLAGEPLQNQLVQQIYQRSQVKRVFNLYGPSEDTTYSTFSLIEQGATTSPTIGRPISNTQVYILDQYLQPVPVGVPGELHLGGVGLARGYLNRPELTQEKFISHPFDTGRLYKTGDLVRYLPSGNIEYLARIDNQVKIRGFRIELGEIEGVLSQHRDLQASCIIAREDNSGDKRLVAYVVAKHGYELSISQLRSFLSGQLPQYMVPHIFVILKSLPLTLNGKIDRRALPEPNSAELLADSFVAPRNQIEEILTQIWAEVLRVEKVGINDNFFELGGHSLLATQVISHIRQTLNQEIPLRLLFEYPTIGQFSQHIDINKLTDNDLLTSSIEARGNLEQIPLSFAQQRLWFLDQLQPHSNAYNLVYNFEIQGLLNIPALERSIAEIIERHDILRTNFQMVDGEPTQIIRDSNFNLSVIDLQSLSDEHQEREIAEITKQEAEISFNLAEDVLFRVKLIRWNQEKNLLLFNIHHIIFDGWSFSILVAELEELYTAYSQGLISPLTKLSIQYSDFSFWQRKWLVGNVLELQLNYWKQKLSGNLPILELPIDHLRPRMQTYKGATKSFVLSQELTASITSLAQQEGVTVFMTLLAAFKVLLCRYSGQEDVIVGTPIAGRNRKEIEGLMGFFVNTLALRTDLGAHPSFRELLSRVRQVCLEAYTHQDVPFEQLVEVLQPERDLSHTPIFQVMFALQNVPIGELQLPNLSVKPLEPLVKTAKFDLTLSMEERNGCLVGEWEYNTDLFDDTTIERMVKNFQVLLSGILTAPEQNIWELPLLDETERHQLLVTWNHHQVSFTNDQCIHQLFEEQVEKHLMQLR
ncbi:non-ribosomal peptide synthetase [Nostoc sp. CMAA1605]|uniref:non-ribosomal peptide synthetase n=1 Tax=Nostoc sp. CMAA1605 TaxID=2055159 RepID=UPI001F27BBEE|nr:non-ribosomal peptide synthetase [Nostoc sp. CMAA1605]